jgi:hypothetical protein
MGNGVTGNISFYLWTIVAIILTAIFFSIIWEVKIV